VTEPGPVLELEAMAPMLTPAEIVAKKRRAANALKIPDLTVHEACMLAEDVLELVYELEQALMVAEALGEGLRRARHAA